MLSELRVMWLVSWQPIHFNQTYGVVAERLLELPSIKGVHVHMDGPSVCNTSGARTEVTFTQNFGSLPPARVTTLDLRDGGSKYDSSVKMVTESFLSCDVCTGCAGGFYLGFLDVWTDLIEWNATLPELEAGLRDLATFSGPNAVYGPVTVNVTSTLTASGWTSECAQGEPGQRGGPADLAAPGTAAVVVQRTT